MELPQLPTAIDRYLHHTEKCKTRAELREATAPYIQYESKLREIFAQYPDHPAAKQHHLIPLYGTDSPVPTVRARDLVNESEQVRDRYLLGLPAEERKANGVPAIVGDISEFKTNFNLFSESSLVDLDWSNVIVAGSGVVTALLPVPAPHDESKRSLRAYYHQILAPASDVDLFLYGLNEEQAIEKIKTIERAIRDSILSETTTIRTKNAITIVSEYPTRHVQIVLRLYKSVTEILTGFDVDCSCVAYDGKQVWASPRALAAFMTQLNTIDLTRRSPSYENRLSKYSHRGFEVHWPALERSRIDPTIYERSFSRVLGLARLLVLEKLPHPNDRDTYLAKRREERGRPPLPHNSRYRHVLAGNVKDAQPDDIAEWVEEDDVSSYHTFTIPYGPKYNAKKIEKLLFTKDLLLNAEWNRQKDREANLHRHPAFFGSVEDVIHDCCGFCPKPETDEDLAALEQEAKIYISGEVKFLKDDPGRQTIGSFHPLTDDDWTEQAYVGNTAVLCQAIVDKDIDAVIDWFSNGELKTVDVNQRDHAGRTPLLLATMCSTFEIVQYLIDQNARIVSRLCNGLTALHIAAFRGDLLMVKALLDRSEENQTEEDRKEETRRKSRRAAIEPVEKGEGHSSVSDTDSEVDEDGDESSDEMTDGSFVKIAEKPEDTEDEQDEPDVYDIDVLAWDSPLSALHLAILAGSVDVVKLLIDQYGADALLPVKIVSKYNRTPQGAILSLILAFQQSLGCAEELIGAVLRRGVPTTQGDMNRVSALHYAINLGKDALIRALTMETDPAILKKAINHVAVSGSYYSRRVVDVPLVTAIRNRQPDVVDHLLSIGALPEVDFEAFARGWAAAGNAQSDEDTRKDYNKKAEQPLVVAVQMEMPQIAMKLIEAGADVNVCPPAAHEFLDGRGYLRADQSLLDLVDGHIKRLSEYLDEQQQGVKEPSAPAAFEADETYLDYPKDTYRYWTAVGNLERAKNVKAYQQKDYQQEIARIKSQPPKCSEEKLAAVRAVLHEMEVLKMTLVKKGAKGFHELFPKAPEANQYRNYGYHRPSTISNEPYMTTFKFRDSALTDAKRELYLRLFEAAWIGDIGVVKALSLTSEEPLPVAIQDSAGFSPFSIAVFRGHIDLARVILEISTVQYKPDGNEPKYRYYLGGHGDSSDCESDASSTQSDDEPRVFAEIVDDKFTVDDIATLADSVKSKISPLNMVEWSAEWWRSHDGKLDATKAAYAFSMSKPYAHNVGDMFSWAWFNMALVQESSRCSSTLARHAIVKNDMKMLKFVIQVGTELMARKEVDDEASRAYTLPSGDFDFAVGLGRIEMVGEIITTTGAAIPLQAMVKTSGIDLNEKPKYYQGLSVHGKKRQDWAARGRGHRRQVHAFDFSLVLRSIFKGNLQSAEYFLSDAPLRRYLEFTKRFETDKRIQGLAQAKGGIEGTLSTWLDTRSELAMHVAVMAAPMQDGKSPMFDYILRTRRDTIEVKAGGGDTPLHTAFKLQRIRAAKALLDAGANQVARNDQGENVLHMVLGEFQYIDPGPEVLHALLSLLDPKLVAEMLMEKSNAVDPSVNPLALLLTSARKGIVAFEACKVIFEFSKGKDLEVLNGAGDYILHTLVRGESEYLVKNLVEYRPEMLYWENATGMTPFDVAETAYLRDLTEHPPSLQDVRNATITKEPDQKFQLGRTKTEDELAQEKIDAFITGDEKEDLTGRRKPWRMYRLLQKLAQKHEGKRKLVSVLEANEVAKRLAAQQQVRNAETRRQERMGLYATGMQLRESSRYASSYSTSEQRAEDDDEVKRWHTGASQARKWDWERWTAGVLGKEFVVAQGE